TQPWSSPEEAIGWYTSDGWRADRAGEEILRDLSKPAPALLTVITPLRAAYRARWEQAMIEWSRVWTEGGCPVPDLPSAGEWLNDQLEQKRPTAILVLDALRYDLGCALADRINHQEGTSRAKVSSAHTALPSITPLGMALALPISEAQLEADLVGGKWQVRDKERDANLSTAAARRAWWLEQGGVAAEALLEMSAVLNTEVPAPDKGRTCLIVHDAAIDTLGHDDQLEAQGTSAVLDRYLSAVERLRIAGWLRILVVTDHGYIHWPVSEEKNAPPPLATPEPTYSSRRALVYPAQVTFAGPQGLAPGGRWRVAVPYGAASFRAYGGLGYFHGGASLQEWVIPCLTVEWPLQARPVGVALQSLPQVLSQHARVPLRVERGSLFIEEAIPRKVEVVIRDAGTHTILFRSQAMTVTPDREEVDVVATVLEGMIATRGTSLRIEVRDSGTEKVLDASESMLAIDLAGW
ncbi:PglZ domain-containing protein, partial [Chloroflexota bacterium]